MRQQILRVGVVDREQPFRAGVGSVLERAGHRVVAGGSLESLESVSVDLLLLDQRLFVPGLQLPPFAVAAHKPSFDDLLRAFSAGAIGYIDRAISAERLVAAVEDAALGVPVMPPALAALLFDRLLPRGRGAEATPRQRQIQALRQQGLGTREIAALLGVSPITVRRHAMDAAKRTQRAA